MSEYRTLAERINRALAAVPTLARNLANKAPAPAPVEKTRRKAATGKKRTRRADQDTLVMPAIQLSFLWNNNQTQGDQDQAG